MSAKHQSFTIKLISLLLCLTLVSPCIASAAVVPEVQPCASDYLGLYQTYICAVGNGEIQVWFNVVGSGTQDELGTLSIMLYESSDNQNWTWKTTFLHENYSNMLGFNKPRHMSYVSYQGTAGKYYKAYVCIWGGSDGNGDTRYLWASSEQAT